MALVRSAICGDVINPRCDIIIHFHIIIIIIIIIILLLVHNINIVIGAVQSTTAVLSPLRRLAAPPALATLVAAALGRGNVKMQPEYVHAGVSIEYNLGSLHNEPQPGG